jgi:hypothetical protein
MGVQIRLSFGFDTGCRWVIIFATELVVAIRQEVEWASDRVWTL